MEEKEPLVGKVEEHASYPPATATRAASTIWAVRHNRLLLVVWQMQVNMRVRCDSETEDCAANDATKKRRQPWTFSERWLNPDKDYVNYHNFIINLSELHRDPCSTVRPYPLVEGSTQPHTPRAESAGSFLITSSDVIGIALPGLILSYSSISGVNARSIPALIWRGGKTTPCCLLNIE